MKKCKCYSILLLGLILLLVNSIIACGQPPSTPAPSTQPPPATESPPPDQPPPSEEVILTVEVGESDIPARTIGGHALPACNLAIRLGCNSDEGVWVHNMVLRSDSAEETFHMKTLLSRRGHETCHVYLPYQTPMIEVILQGLDGEILFHETLPAPTPPPTPQPGQEPVLVTKDASEIALCIGDFLQSQSWSQTELSAITMFHEGAETTYGVRFYRATWTGYAMHQQFIFNEVAVFPSVELAQEAYDEIESTLVSNVSDPHIGDKLWYYIGVGQSITFRKANVVVYVRLTFGGDIKCYAEICEGRIQ